MRNNGQDGKAKATAVLSARCAPELRDRVEAIRQSYQRSAPPGITISLGDAVRAMILEGVSRTEDAERQKARAAG